MPVVSNQNGTLIEFHVKFAAPLAKMEISRDF